LKENRERLQAGQAISTAGYRLEAQKHTALAGLHHLEEHQDSTFHRRFR